MYSYMIALLFLGFMFLGFILGLLVSHIVNIKRSIYTNMYVDRYGDNNELKVMLENITQEDLLKKHQIIIRIINRP